MHYFVVRERQDEILVEMVEHRKSEVVLVELAVDRVALEVVQRVVHPAHVPLERETQAAQVRRTRDLRPRCRFLSDGHHTGTYGVDEMVEAAQEFDRFPI